MRVSGLNFRREDIPDLSTGERTDKLIRGLNAFGGDVEGLLNRGLTFKANHKAFAKDITFTPEDDWVTLSLTNSWVVIAGYEVPACRKEHGRVWLRGSLKDGTVGSAAFTLPAGYRPGATIGVPLSCAAAPAYMSITAAGASAPSGAAGVNAGLSFDGASFMSADPSPAPNGVFPISIKNEIPGSPTPSHVWLTRAVDLTNDREEPVSLGQPAWTVSKDQIVIRDVANVLAGRRYRLTILVVAE